MAVRPKQHTKDGFELQVRANAGAAFAVQLPRGTDGGPESWSHDLPARALHITAVWYKPFGPLLLCQPDASQDEEAGKPGAGVAEAVAMHAAVDGLRSRYLPAQVLRLPPTSHP